MCCNDRKYSCLFLFTPWKTLQLTRTRGRSERLRVIHLLNQAVFLSAGLHMKWHVFVSLSVYMDLYTVEFPPQWKQRSSRLSVVVSVRPHFDQSSTLYPLGLSLCSQWCDWGSVQIRALWLAESKEFAGKCQAQWWGAYLVTLGKFQSIMSSLKYADKTFLFSF